MSTSITHNIPAAVSRLAGARARIRAVILRTYTEGGEKMRTRAVQQYRSKRSATSTGRITGNLANSYGFDVKAEGDGAELGFGLLRSSAKGDALKYGAVHEFGATIKPKNGPRLTFKTPDGWRSAKSVRIPARPAIEPTARYYAPVLERILADRMAEAI